MSCYKVNALVITTQARTRTLSQMSEDVAVVVQSLSRVRRLVTPWTVAWQAPLSSTMSHGLLKLMPIEPVMPSNQLILCGPHLLLPSIFPASECFPISWLFTSGGFSISPFSEYSGWFPLGLTAFISLLFKGLSRVFSSTTIWKYQLFDAQPSLWSNSHISMWLLEKPYFDYMNLCWQSDISAFNYAVKIYHSFPSKEQMSFRLQSPSAVICEPKKIKSVWSCASSQFQIFLSTHKWNKSAQSCPSLWDPMDPLRAHQAPLSMEFPRQGYWSGVSFSSPGDLPDPGMEPASPSSPALVGEFFTTSVTGEPSFYTNVTIINWLIPWVNLALSPMYLSL